MLFVVCWLLVVVGCVLRVLIAACWLLSVVCCWLFLGCYSSFLLARWLFFVVCCVSVCLSVVGCLMFVVRCSLFVVCWLLFVGCCCLGAWWLLRVLCRSWLFGAYCVWA